MAFIWRPVSQDPGEVVWVQNEGANSKEWFECIVASKRPEPGSAIATVYQLVMRDDGRPFADGRYLPARRLHDKPSNKQSVKSKWTPRPEDDLEFEGPSVFGKRTRGPKCRLDTTPAIETVQSSSYDDKSHSGDVRLHGHGNFVIGQFSGPETALSYDKDQVTRVMAEQPRVLELVLAWDVVAILRGQHASGKIAAGCLSETIVYNGTPTMWYATTVQQYAKKLWPRVCSPALECIEHALSSSGDDFTPSRMHTAKFYGIIITIELNGATTHVKIERDRTVAAYPRSTMSGVSTLLY